MHTRFKRVLLSTLLGAALLVMVGPAAPVSAAAGTISLIQTSGTPTSPISITASGFTPNLTYSVVWAGTTVLQQGTTGATGNFTSQFTVPANYPRGTYNVTMTTPSDTSNTVAFALLPQVNLSVASGNVADQITVVGYGFTASSTVSVYFDSAVILTTSTSSLGAFSTPFTIPKGQRGSHTIRVLDVAAGDFHLFAFTILQKIGVAPVDATVGTMLAVTANGFAASQTATVYFDEVLLATTSTDSLGSFTLTTIALPASTFGNHSIRATDTSGNSYTATVNTKQSMSITPTSGPIGTKVTVTGTGFRASESITISYDNTPVSTATVSTDVKGSFTATVDVPASSSGAHPIKAADSLNADTKSFTIASTASASPTSGFVGTKIAVVGNGYLANQTVSVLFDNQLAKTVVADARGSFNTSFDAPSKPAGVYKIRITDGVNLKDLDFRVTTSASISPTSESSPGAVGSLVTVNGVGFKAGATVTVTYDGQQIKTGTVGADSNFSITFNAPASKAGQHTVTVSDGTVSMPLTFYMEGKAPSPPALIEPQSGVRAKAEPLLTWNAVSDPSGVTYVLQISDNPSFAPLVLEETGLAVTEYTLTQAEKLKPSPKGGAYYWRVKAIDGASNEGGWSNANNFTVGTPFPRWALWTMIGLGALIILLFAYWLGRRAAVNRPPSKRLDDQGQL